MNKKVDVTYPILVLCESEKNKYNLLSNLFYITEDKDKSAFELVITKDENIFSDGYSLRIKKDRIEIVYNEKRGLRYAFYTLNKIANDHKGYLPLIYIVDEPSFRLRGIIEGYYGTPWTYEERLDMVSFMDERKLNVYMYAPKSDCYHREKWNVLYPEEELTKLIDLKNRLYEKDIDFYYCISPGYKKDGCKAFDYCNSEDYQILYNKLDQVIEKGITKFGLLLDDIDYTLTGKALEEFQTPGRAHSHICNKVYEYLKSKIHTGLEMVMCPTEYVQIGSTPYRKDIDDNMDKNIAVFWTGYNCCAEVILTDDTKKTAEAFGSKLYIWDNFPVSDFTRGTRQYMAPVINRSPEIGKYADAYIINPMEDYYISKVSMYTMADFSWNTYKYDSEVSFHNALESIADGFYNASIDYVNFNYPNVLSFGNLDYEKEMVINHEYEKIDKYYEKAVKSAKRMLKYNLEIINELKPWLTHLLSERKVIKKIIDPSISNEDKTRAVKKLLKDIHFSGSEVLDYLIQDLNLLTVDEFNDLIIKRRGKPWYRTWEIKR